ncbi:MAG: S8 family serine peptidase, partial [gamma proteobacterium symbiont of Clathrolucina costata]
MPGNFKHLKIEREPLQNDRRTRRINMPHPERGDMRTHGQRLVGRLHHSVHNARQQLTSRPGSFVLKIRYAGHFDTAHLSKHGIEFISQEDKQLCVVFTDEQGLAVFEEHLNRLGLDGVELNYKQILEAIEGIDNWTAEDRKSWAVIHKGFPATESFILDIELWPVKVSNHPDRLGVCNAFEAWLQEQQIRRLDKVNLDSLLIYRLEVNTAQAELLLNHTDVRTVDLAPISGITYRQISSDIETLPRAIPRPSAQAARVCVLDSGINTNHPLIAPAMAESASFIDRQEPFDENGHGTAVAGIVLYGDLEACNSSNYWNPEILLFNGRILDKDARGFNFEVHNGLCSLSCQVIMHQLCWRFEA